MKYDDLMDLFKNRRSLRKFKADPVPDEYVDKIIEAARFAPSGFNTQPWEFVVIKNRGLKNKIVQAIDEYKTNQFDYMETLRESWRGLHEGFSGREPQRTKETTGMLCGRASEPEVIYKAILSLTVLELKDICQDNPFLRVTP
jgi:nitroreductase